MVCACLHWLQLTSVSHSVNVTVQSTHTHVTTFLRSYQFEFLMHHHTTYRKALTVNFIMHNDFLADHTNGRAYATVLRPSSLSVVVVCVCNVMYCG